ncbi:MAG TPA: hypothetical protein VI911_11300 [Patescibacteria group bacterium]|nr:hypothetical protein [Patescibacteria group bacterium]
MTGLEALKYLLENKNSTIFLKDREKEYKIGNKYTDNYFPTLLMRHSPKNMWEPCHITINDFLMKEWSLNE